MRLMCERVFVVVTHVTQAAASDAHQHEHWRHEVRNKCRSEHLHTNGSIHRRVFCSGF